MVGMNDFFFILFVSHCFASKHSKTKYHETLIFLKTYLIFSYVYTQGAGHAQLSAGVYGGQKKTLDLLKLELELAVHCSVVDAGN